MNRFLQNLRLTWHFMFTAPWHHSEQAGNEFADKQTDDARRGLAELAVYTQSINVRWVMETLETGRHWFRWVVGWMYALCGVVGGALVAPSLVKSAGLTWFPHQDWLVIGIASIAGFLVHLLSWIVLANSFVGAGLFFRITNRMVARKVQPGGMNEQDRMFILALRMCGVLTGIVGLLIGLALPVTAVSYGVYRYLMWIGPGQRAVTVAFIGGLLINTIWPPIWHYLGGVVLFRIFNWLRGDKAKAKSA